MKEKTPFLFDNFQNAASKNTMTSKSSPAASQEGRKRHRLSQAHVRLERLNFDTSENVIVHRTRNALVAEFKEKNIMTRNRKSLDQVKSPTQRMEQLKKLTPTSSGKTLKSNLSNNTLPMSPSVTPLPKRRSVSDRSSPIPINMKLLDENNTSKNSRQNGKSRIPTRSASTSLPSSSSSTSSLSSSNSRVSNSSSQINTKSKLPRRKSNRNTSQISIRKK